MKIIVDELPKFELFQRDDERSPPGDSWGVRTPRHTIFPLPEEVARVLAAGAPLLKFLSTCYRRGRPLHADLQTVFGHLGLEMDDGSEKEAVGDEPGLQVPVAAEEGTPPGPPVLQRDDRGEVHLRGDSEEDRLRAGHGEEVEVRQEPGPADAGGGAERAGAGAGGAGARLTLAAPIRASVGSQGVVSLLDADGHVFTEVYPGQVYDPVANDKRPPTVAECLAQAEALADAYNRVHAP